MSRVENHCNCIREVLLCLRVGFVGFILKHKILGTYFVRCDMNDVKMPQALYIRRNIV